MKYVIWCIFTINVCILLENILEKITDPSNLLEIQQNLSDDEEKAKLSVGDMYLKWTKCHHYALSDLLEITIFS